MESRTAEYGVTDGRLSALEHCLRSDFSAGRSLMTEAHTGPDHKPRTFRVCLHRSHRRDCSAIDRKLRETWLSVSQLRGAVIHAQTPRTACWPTLGGTVGLMGRSP